MTASYCTSTRDFVRAPNNTRLKKTSSNSSRESTPKEETGASKPGSMPDQEPSFLSLAMPPNVNTMLQSGVLAAPERDNVRLGPNRDARPFNFGTVIPGLVYRSSYPEEHDYRFIQGLRLKSVVTLVQKEMPPTFKPFLDSAGILHHVFDMKGTKKESIPAETMRSILAVVLDPAQHPLLIHCNHGKHRTGCVVGVLRKISGWTLDSIHAEYKSYAEPKCRETDLEYLANFDVTHVASLFPRPSAFHTTYALRRRPRSIRVVIAAIALALFVYYLFFRLICGGNAPGSTQ